MRRRRTDVLAAVLLAALCLGTAPSSPLVSAAVAAETKPATDPKVRVVKVTAKKFEFSPSVIRVKRGEEVEIELTSLDRRHGFDVPGLGIHSDVKPGSPTRIRLKAEKAGSYPFHCSVFCGSGHEGMTGEIVVE
jgi:cytochrome c oxidase subunit II